MRRLRLVLVAAFLIGLSSCGSCRPELPEVRSSDAGDYSFVRQAIPKLTGRKARGYAEVKVLADMIGVTNRPTVLRAMFLQPELQHEYIEHWSENVVDFMRAHRETGKLQTGSGECFGPGLRTQPDYTTTLAEFVRDNAPNNTSVPGGAFNMSDLLRSSFALDNVSPAYRAYLFAMVHRPITGNEITPQNQRDDLGATFVRVYSDRQLTCLTCHNTVSSTTGSQTFWNRHFPIRGQFSTALFGSTTGRPSETVHAILRTDVASGSIRPWGSNNCGSFIAQASVPVDPLSSPAGTPISAYFTRELGSRASIWHVENLLHTGYDRLLTEGLRRGPPAGGSSVRCSYCSGASTCPSGSSTSVPPLDAAGVAREADALSVLTGAGCFGCHGSGLGGLLMDATNFKTKLIGVNSLNSPSQLLVSPGNAGASYLMTILDSPTDPLSDGTRRMPFGSPQLSLMNRDKIRNWINGLAPSSGCASCTANVCETDHLQGDAAFAFLTAGRIVENTWDELIGAPLTVPNRFPRNVAQRDILWTLTETQFVSSTWSMRQLLSRIMTTDFFNRLSPSLSTGPSSYELPPSLDPWVVGDPRLPPIALPGTPPGSGMAPTPDPAYDRDTEANRPRHYNSMSDGVHRYSPRSLLQSVHKALGWPAPPRESSSDYPNDNLRKSLGQFYRDAEPGFREIGFQGLLNWEEVHGRCQTPSNHTGDDWIDRLVAAIPGFNAANPTNRAQFRDVVLALKDRLLADASIQTSTPTDVTQTEAAALAALFGAALTAEPDLSTRAAAIAFEQKVRDACGIMLETPQYMLAGIAPTELGERPRLLVCQPGEPCGYREVCESYVGPMGQLGYILTCRDDSLSVASRPTAPNFGLPEFCPRGRCGTVPWEGRQIDKCLLQPQACFGEPPGCDPRCELIDCCGGPLPPLDGRELLLFWADGGQVKQAANVQVLRAPKNAFEPLQPGAQVKTGEVLVLTSESQLEIETPEGNFKTPEGGLRPRGNTRHWFVQITGPQALEPRQRDQLVVTTPVESSLELSNKLYWLAEGEAGLPTLPNQRKEPSLLPGKNRQPRPTTLLPAWQKILPPSVRQRIMRR